MYKKNCVHCNKEFVSKYGFQKYCSVKCGYAYSYLNRREKHIKYCSDRRVLEREKQKYLRSISPDELLKEVGYFDKTD